MKYLSSDLTVTKMYDMYVEKCMQTNDCPVKLWCYRDIFNTKFNLSFHPPRKDTCKRCDLMKLSIEAAKGEGDEAKAAQVQGEHELHLRKAEAARTALEAERQESASHEAFTFDLQKVLSLPKLSTNEVYYCRQLSVYNLGIHSLTTNKVTMNVWDETVASRGAEDIGSCLLQYCLALADVGIKTISAYSDSCGGQNRNHKIALIWMHICEISNIEEINHKFLVCGHSYLPNDSDFGVIERATQKSCELYVPEQWCSIIEKCSRKNPYTVVRMKQEMFVSVSDLVKRCTVRKTSLQGNKVEWLKIQWIQVRKSSPMKLYFKYSIQEDIAFDCVDFGKKDRGVQVLSSLKPANDQHRTLSKEKAQDLKKLLKYVPPIYHEFYTTKTSQAVLSSSHEVLEEQCSDSETETPSTTRSASRSSTVKKNRICEHAADTGTPVTTQNGGRSTRSGQRSVRN